MKKYFFLFIAAISTSLFVGCSEDELEAPNYASFQKSPSSAQVDFGGSTTYDVAVYTANVVGSDRTFDVVVRDATTLGDEAFNVPATVTIPGGSNEGVLSVGISDVNISPNGEKLILGFGAQDGQLFGGDFTLNVSQFCDPAFVIDFVFDGYASETTWDLADATGTVVLSGGGFSDGTSLASVMRCIPAGEYTFTVYDAYGDGLTYPAEGSVTLSYGGQELTVIPGAFGTSASFTFTVE